MWIDVFFGLLLLAYAVAIVFLILAWRTDNDDRYDKLARLAAMVSCGAGLATLISNYIVLFSPELYGASFDFIMLVAMATIVPGVVLTGAIAILFGRNAGVKILAIGLGLWVCTSLLGYAAMMIGAFE